MLQLNDLVVVTSSRTKVPVSTTGMVQKATVNYVWVEWNKPASRTYWAMGRIRNWDDLPPVCKVAQHTVSLVERRGGPW